MRTRTITSIVLILLIGLSACSIRPKASALHDLGYPLSGTPSETALPQKLPPVTVEAPKWLEDNRIRYRLLFATPTQVRFYALDRWLAPPPELFEQLLNNSGKQWPVPLMIQLQAYEQQFTAPDKAVAVMHFTAVTMPDEDKNHSSRREFKLQRPCPTADAKGAVSAFSELARQSADKIQAWLLTLN